MSRKSHIQFLVEIIFTYSCFVQTKQFTRKTSILFDMNFKWHKPICSALHSIIQFHAENKTTIQHKYNKKNAFEILTFFSLFLAGFYIIWFKCLYFTFFFSECVYLSLLFCYLLSLPKDFFGHRIELIPLIYSWTTRINVNILITIFKESTMNMYLFIVFLLIS